MYINQDKVKKIDLFLQKNYFSRFYFFKKFVLAALVQLQLYIFCVSAPAAVSRRLSLDTQRAEKAGRQKEQPANTARSNKGEQSEGQGTGPVPQKVGPARPGPKPGQTQQ